jgi:hypothetical protein
MPIFLYSHPKTEEIREVIQSVHEEHIFIDEEGVKWQREFTVPTAAIDTRWNAHDPRDFVEKTKKYKGGTIGDLWEKSAELGEKREKEMGKDPVKEKMYENYKKSHGGKSHPDIKKKKLKEKLAKNKSFGWED